MRLQEWGLGADAIVVERCVASQKLGVGARFLVRGPGSVSNPHRGTMDSEMLINHATDQQCQPTRLTVHDMRVAG